MRRARVRLPLELARRALERAGADLAAAVDHRQAIQRALQDNRAARARETFEEARALGLLASFIERSRGLERDLRARLAAAEAEEAALAAVLGHRRLELRRLELLDRRAARDERLATARRERRELDEQIAQRRIAPRSEAPASGALPAPRIPGRGSP